MTLTCRVDAAAPAAGFELITLPDAPAVAEQVASLLLQERLRRPQRPLGLATGATMAPVYGAMARQLAALPVAEQRRLREQWLSFNLDEYLGLGEADVADMARINELLEDEDTGCGEDCCGASCLCRIR